MKLILLPLNHKWSWWPHNAQIPIHKWFMKRKYSKKQRKLILNEKNNCSHWILCMYSFFFLSQYANNFTIFISIIIITMWYDDWKFDWCFSLPRRKIECFRTFQNIDYCKQYTNADWDVEFLWNPKQAIRSLYASFVYRLWLQLSFCF